MSGWLLDSVEIEGFRGINNEGDPLVLQFAHDAVNSVSAPNGVGKSSIFDALTFALRKALPKLDDLPATENGGEYYLNRFHSKDFGTIRLTICPVGGGAYVPITVTRDASGVRTASAPAGIDAEQLLASLDRDFVLLDHKTLQSFIDDKALDRGRAFSGLLGLAKYSTLRQELQALANTRAFNNHFDTRTLAQKQSVLKTAIRRQQIEAASAFQALTQLSLVEQPDLNTAIVKAHDALHQIAILKSHCANKVFSEISIDDCVDAVKLAEGGEDKSRLAEVVRLEANLMTLVGSGPSEEDYATLRDLARQRDSALSQTAGSLLRALYNASRDVLIDDKWTEKNKCPTCEHIDRESILKKMELRLAAFQKVEDATSQIESAWTTRSWSELQKLETAQKVAGDKLLVEIVAKRIAEDELTETEVRELWAWRGVLNQRVAIALAAAKSERETLERRLPASLVAVTTAVEAARRLQVAWKEIDERELELTAVEGKISSIQRVKQFVDTASELFAAAEADASERRLAAVEPLCQTLFAAIMHQPVRPSLVKPAGAESLSLGLSQFFTLRDVSAQALLSESFRNAFAVSVYLAAATLYGGAPRFIVLDDVTSSFDAGHQFHLMELIRTQFARPGQTNGPQVIIFSHDTLLEKLFNRNSGQSDWKHQRLEGTARTAVLPQSDAVNRVRDATKRFLDAGQVDDAAPRLRQYLEYRLLEIISKAKVPVPIDFALDDNNKQVNAAINAIEAAVKLHNAAGDLVLDAAQQTGLQTYVASITGNFLAHYATGSTHAFSAASLLGVMNAIDSYAECFMVEDPPGHKRFYKSLSKR